MHESLIFFSRRIRSHHTLHWREKGRKEEEDDPPSFRCPENPRLAPSSLPKNVRCSIGTDQTLHVFKTPFLQEFPLPQKKPQIFLTSSSVRKETLSFFHSFSSWLDCGRPIPLSLLVFPSFLGDSDSFNFPVRIERLLSPPPPSYPPILSSFPSLPPPPCKKLSLGHKFENRFFRRRIEERVVS